MKYLVTGSSGFIGSYLCERILQDNTSIVIGIDNMNSYYDVNLKKSRLERLEKYPNFQIFQIDISDKNALSTVFKDNLPDYVINLAAQAGVRYSITNPDVYITSNIVGFYNILELCREFPVKHLVFASSSSVYGNNNKIPYSTQDMVDKPVSLYAATKKSNELLAHAYSKLYNIPTTGLRFFTVYGPAGRPDMAYFDFTNQLLNGGTIKIFNHGKCKRDFTYIDDVIEGIARIVPNPPKNSNPMYKIYNIGHGEPVNLLEFVTILQEELINAGVLQKDYNFKEHQELVPMQPGDVEITFADTTDLEKDFGYKPSTTLRTGLKNFAKWYKEYYGV